MLNTRSVHSPQPSRQSGQASPVNPKRRSEGLWFSSILVACSILLNLSSPLQAHLTPEVAEVQMEQGVPLRSMGAIFPPWIFSEGLFVYDRGGEVIPGVALSWKQEAEGRCWTFKLKPNKTWTDEKTPVCAEDFVRGWKWSFTPGHLDAELQRSLLRRFPLVGAKERVASGWNRPPAVPLGVEALSTGELRVVLEEELDSSAFFEALAMPFLAPCPPPSAPHREGDRKGTNGQASKYPSANGEAEEIDENDLLFQPMERSSMAKAGYYAWRALEGLYSSEARGRSPLEPSPGTGRLLTLWLNPNLEENPDLPHKKLLETLSWVLLRPKAPTEDSKFWRAAYYWDQHAVPEVVPKWASDPKACQLELEKRLELAGYTAKEPLRLICVGCIDFRPVKRGHLFPKKLKNLVVKEEWLDWSGYCLRKNQGGFDLLMEAPLIPSRTLSLRLRDYTLYEKARARLDEPPFERQPGETLLRAEARICRELLAVPVAFEPLMFAPFAKAPDGWIHRYYSREGGMPRWQETPRPRREQLLRVGLRQENPLNLHPYACVSTADSEVLCNLFEGLYGYDGENGELTNLLAQSLESNEEGTEWTVQLRPGVRWSDGRPLTAHDFVFGWRALFSPQTYGARASRAVPEERRKLLLRTLRLHRAKEVTIGGYPPEHLGVWAAGDSVLKFRLVSPINRELLMHRLAGYEFVPMRPEFLKNQTELGRGVELKSWPCNGPFQLDTRLEDGGIRLKRNVHYWAAEHVQLETIEYHWMEPARLAEAWEEGCLDIADAYPTAENPLRDWVRGYLYGLFHAGVTFFPLNLSDEALGDVRVRQALELLLDREGLIQARLRQTDLSPAFGPLSGGTALKCIIEEPKWTNWTWEKRVQTAESLLKESGYTAIHPLKLSLSLQKEYFDEQAFFAQVEYRFNAAKNLRVECKRAELKSLRNFKTTGAFQIVLQKVFFGDFHPLTPFRIFVSSDNSNWFHYRNEEYDQLFRRLEGNSLEETEYFEFLNQLQTILQSDLPCLFFCRDLGQILVNDEVGGFVDPRTPGLYSRRAHPMQNVLCKRLFIKEPYPISWFPQPKRSRRKVEELSSPEPPFWKRWLS